MERSAKEALVSEDPVRQWAPKVIVDSSGRQPRTEGTKDIFSATKGQEAQGTLYKAELLKLFHISIPRGR